MTDPPADPGPYPLPPVGRAPLRIWRDPRLLGTAIAVALLVAGCLALQSPDSSPESAAPEASGAAAPPEPPDPTEPTVRPTPTSLPVSTEPVDPECPPEDGAPTRQTLFTAAPPMCLDADATYEAEVQTTRGVFTIRLDQDTAPLGVNSFVFLARWRVYDGVTFHRVVRDMLLQGGDPYDPGVGTTGAGYFLPEEPPVGEPFYRRGSVAMANSGPNTTGSEFFVVSGEAGELLPPSYTQIGQVVDGLEVIDAINATAVPDDDIGFPTEPTVVEAITVTEVD